MKQRRFANAIEARAFRHERKEARLADRLTAQEAKEFLTHMDLVATILDICRDNPRDVAETKVRAMLIEYGANWATPTVTDKARNADIPLTPIGDFNTPDNRKATVYTIGPYTVVPSAPAKLTPEQQAKMERDRTDLNRLSEDIAKKFREGNF